MDPKAITDQHKAACNGILLNHAASPEIRIVTQAILDANKWLDGLYEDIRKLDTHNSEAAERITALESRIANLERQIQLR